MSTHIYTQPTRWSLILATIITLSATPTSSAAFPLSIDTEILLLFAGPVSEAVQETVLLVRRGDNFVTKESLTIGCVAGASSGFLVGIAPLLGFVDITMVSPPGTFHVVGTMLLSCAMSIFSGVVGMGTAWSLQELRAWQEINFISK